MGAGLRFGVGESQCPAMMNPAGDSDTRAEEPIRGRDGVEDGLRRVLGPFDATCVVVGAIIGVGIFFTPTSVAGIAGSQGLALLAWAVGGGIALCGALTFAELGTHYPRTGGQYELLRDAFGAAVGFLFVFSNATAIQSGAIAIIALVCADYVQIAAGRSPTPWVSMVGALALIASVSAANGVGVRWGAGIQNLTVVAKVATLVAVALLAARTASNAPATAVPAATNPALDAGVGGAVGLLFSAMVPAFFAYGGWQHALWISGEVRRPRRNLPLAIVGGVLVVVAVYLLANWAYFRLLGFDGVASSKAVAADAVAVPWDAVGRRVIAAAVAFSAYGVLNAQLLSGPRLIYRLAADGRFFPLFARVQARFATPIAAILLLGALGGLLVLVARQASVDRLLNGVVFIDGIFFVLTGAALFRLRGRVPRAARSRAFGYPLAPALFVLGETGVVLGAARDPGNRVGAAAAVIWLAAAALCYRFYFARRPPR